MPDPDPTDAQTAQGISSPARTVISPPPTEPKPEPPPAAAVPAAGEPAKPAVAPPETLIKVVAPDGSEQFATAQQLADYARETAAKALSPEEMTEFDTFRKVKAGDAETILKVFGAKADDADAAQAVGEISPEALTQLQKRLDEQAERLNRIEPTYQRITQLTDQTGLQTIIQQHAEHLPHLAKAATEDPVTIQEVLGYMHQATEAVRSQGVDPAQLPAEKQMELQARVLRYAEDRLAKLAGVFGETTAAAGGRQVQATDDQAAQKSEATIPPRIRFVDGKMVNAQGQQVVQTTDGQLVPVTVEGHIPSTAVAGVAAGDTTGGQQNKAMTAAELENQLKARLQTMAPPE